MGERVCVSKMVGQQKSHVRYFSRVFPLFLSRLHNIPPLLSSPPPTTRCYATNKTSFGGM